MSSPPLSSLLEEALPPLRALADATEKRVATKADAAAELVGNLGCDSDAAKEALEGVRWMRKEADWMRAAADGVEARLAAASGTTLEEFEAKTRDGTKTFPPLEYDVDPTEGLPQDNVIEGRSCSVQ